MNNRKNQSTLTTAEWDRLIAAVNAMHGMGIPAPRYRDFVRVHVDAMSAKGMSWGVHRMPGMDGRNFLAWHRWFLVRMEQRLQVVDPAVTLPYWDWIADPALPAAINKPAQLTAWGVDRQWNPNFLPSQAEVASDLAITDYSAFQLALEHTHDKVHAAVGGTMDSASSPTDPLFFLHHANIDRLFAQWQVTHAGTNPPNATEVLKPKPLFGVKVSSVLDIATLGYQYV